MMASSDASSSDDDISQIVKKRNRRHKNIVPSETEDDDSDIELNLRLKKKGVLQLKDSESEAEDELSTDVAIVASQTDNKDLTNNNNFFSPNEASDGEQTDKCAICLSKFLGQDVATPEICDHVFCSECLREWAKKVNTCPIDRLKFDLILERHHDDDKVFRKISVKNAEEFVEVESDPLDVTYCEFCGECDSEETLLLCDECELGFHCECLTPPLYSIPEGRWYCPHCAPFVRLHEEIVNDFQRLIQGRFKRISSSSLTVHPLERSQDNRSHVPDLQENGNPSVPSQPRSRRSQSRVNSFLSSSESSDEGNEQRQTAEQRSYTRRWRCQEIRNRRQVRLPVHHHFNSLKERLAEAGRNFLNSRQNLHSFESSAVLSADDADEDSYDIQPADGAGVLTRPSIRRNLNRTKTAHDYSTPSAFRSRQHVSQPSSFDLVGEILQTQALLHSPDTIVQRDGSLAPNSGTVGQQRPLNPSQTPSKCNNSDSAKNINYPVASSSSLPSRSGQFYDHPSVSGSTSIKSNTSEGCDPNSTSVHRNYGSLLQENIKKDNRDACHAKEARKSHSEDEVDIYSDIESAGEEDSLLEPETHPISVAYKCDETQLVNAGDGSDSSDNELVIDEDVHVEEDNEKVKDKQHEVISNKTVRINPEETRLESSENSDISDHESENELPCESNVSESIQSPDMQDDSIYENDCSSQQEQEQESRGSCDLIDHVSKDNSEGKSDLDSDVESREENSVDNDADEENSCDSVKDEVDETNGKCQVEFIADNSQNSQDQSEVSSPNIISKPSFENVSLQQPISYPLICSSARPLYGKKPVACNESNLDVSSSEEEFKIKNNEYSMSESVDMHSDGSDGKDNENRVDDNENIRCDSASNEFTELSPNTAFSSKGENGNNFINLDQSSESNSCKNSFQKVEDLQANSDTLNISQDNSNLHEIGLNKVEDQTLEKNLDSYADVCLSGNNSECSKSPAFTAVTSDNHSESKENTLTEDCEMEELEHSNVQVSENEEQQVHTSPCIKSPVKTNDILARQAADLGIEDISDVASEDMSQNEGISMDSTKFVEHSRPSELSDVERNVAQLFEQDSDSSKKEKIKEHRVERTSRYQDDQEEGEIIDDASFQRRESRQDQKNERYTHEEIEDFSDTAPRVNISDLPRIPKIKRDTSKHDVPEELPLEAKRTSVLGRVDLGSLDISWKRLSKHTRERSYRDGRPKDEKVLYREREVRSKDSKKNKDYDSDKKSEEKFRDSEKKKEEFKKLENEKTKEKNHKDKKSDRNKDEYDKSSKSEWGYSSQEKRDKYGKSYKEKYDRDKRERDKTKKDRYEKSKERSSRDDDKYERDKSIERYERDDRYIDDDERYEKEKLKEKEHKHKHKDKKAESSKKSKEERHKRTHTVEHFSEKHEREVRKVDDKLKIVVEHKDSHKEKSDKHSEKKEMKHEKKHKESIHRHHEHRRKEHAMSPYMDMAPIESKEIFAKGDSIIINVNFNRTSPREVTSYKDEESYNRDKRLSCSNTPKTEHLSISDDLQDNKSKRLFTEKDKPVTETILTKRPSTPPERNSQLLSVGECYWQETEDMDTKSPSLEKSSVGKCSTDEEEGANTPIGDFGTNINFTDSDDELPQTQIFKPKEENEENHQPPCIMEDISAENTFTKESNNFNVVRRRSPRSPSPPSPPDNDSYDPCEPTKSPSPPPECPAPPPLPTTAMPPKPPPEPELPPLPPEPEPIDIIREDPRSHKHCLPSSSSETVSATSICNLPVSQQITHYSQSTITPPISLPNVMVPPPNFIPHQVPRSVHNVPTQLGPPRTVNWQVNPPPPPPPPPPMLFPPNHMPQVMRGAFLPSQIPAVNVAPPNVSVAAQMAPMLPPASTVPMLPQVRGPVAIPSASTLPNVPLGNLNITQMHIPHLNHLPPSMPPSVHAHRPAQPQLNSLPVSIQNQNIAISSQNTVATAPISVQNQHLNLVSSTHSPSVNHPTSVQNQFSSSSVITPVVPKLEKNKHSPPLPSEKNEVVDMDVDSPYSPGDSPSLDSTYDYSPPSSPPQKAIAVVRDAFDSLLNADQKTSAVQETSSRTLAEKSSKSRLSYDTKTSLEPSNKKIKIESRHDSSGRVRHSVRLQVTDKGKSRKEQKHSEKKDVLTKLDDSQLKILDELPSSAVEMQVKEKFLIKLNRQERVVEEVKLALKPYYKTREVNKDEYKEILRKSVPKICHNKSGEINPVKVKYLVECYVKKIKHARKKETKKPKPSKYS